MRKRFPGEGAVVIVDLLNKGADALKLVPTPLLSPENRPEEPRVSALVVLCLPAKRSQACQRRWHNSAQHRSASARIVRWTRWFQHQCQFERHMTQTGR